MALELAAALREAVARDADLFELADLLRNYRDAGGTRAEALAILGALRADVTESTEDRILEVMDFAAGYCQPRFRIWPDPPPEKARSDDAV